MLIITTEPFKQLSSFPFAGELVKHSSYLTWGTWHQRFGLWM